MVTLVGFLLVLASLSRLNSRQAGACILKEFVGNLAYRPLPTVAQNEKTPSTPTPLPLPKELQERWYAHP